MKESLKYGGQLSNEPNNKDYYRYMVFSKLFLGVLPYYMKLWGGLKLTSTPLTLCRNYGP